MGMIMMNNRDYFEVSTQYSYFKVGLNFILDDNEFRITAKFDTGCSTTMLSYKDLGISDLDRLGYKKRDIKRYREGKLGLMYSVGVESGGVKLKNPYTLTDDELLHSEYICFKYYVNNFCINGCNLGRQLVKLSYDRRGHSLLGMNIINKCIIHIGSYSLYTILLGVPKEQEDKSTYYALLEKYFFRTLR